MLSRLLPAPSKAKDGPEFRLADILNCVMTLGAAPIVYLRPCTSWYDETYIAEADDELRPFVRAYSGHNDCGDNTVYFPIVWQMTIEDFTSTLEFVGEAMRERTIAYHPIFSSVR